MENAMEYPSLEHVRFLQQQQDYGVNNTNATGIFATCSNASSNVQQLMQCMAQQFEQREAMREIDYRDWMFILCGALVFFMQAGFAMVCAGCVRKKNVQNTLLKNLLDACGAAVAWFSVGFAFAFGGQNDTNAVTFAGSQNFFMTGNIDQGFWFFQYAFCANAVTIVAGTLAERCQMLAYLLYSLFLTSFVYPIVAHAIWSRNGFLSASAVQPLGGIGAIDFAGSGVVHITGGITAVIATYILGARKGRFHDNRGRLLPTPRTIHGHSIALQLMGGMVLWFGWFGFNCGSALSLSNLHTGSVGAIAAVNTSLSAATGCVSALFLHLFVQERLTGEYKFDLSRAINGCLAALVAITAGCATVEAWAAILIGAIAGVLYLVTSDLLVRCRLDDAVDAIPVHLTNGIWGVIAVGFFSSPTNVLNAYGTDAHVGWFYSLGRGSLDATLLGNQCLEVLFILGWVAGMVTPFFLFLNFMGWFRADSLEELVGLDLAYMGQQENMFQAGMFSDEGSGNGGDTGEEEESVNDAAKKKATAAAADHSKQFVQNPDALSDLSGQI